MGYNVGKPRETRIFISHNWSRQTEFYRELCDILSNEGVPWQDLSAGQETPATHEDSEEILLDVELKANLVARIYTADLVIVPSSKTSTKSEWIDWEATLAALAYGIPILFVDHKDNLERRTALIGRLKPVVLKGGGKFRVANKTELSEAIHELLAQKAPTSRPLLDADKDDTSRPPGVLDRRMPLKSSLEKVLQDFPYKELKAGPTLGRRLLFVLLAGLAVLAAFLWFVS